MPYYFYIWSDEIVEHIARNGVTPEKFEAVVDRQESVATSRSSNRPAAFGRINGREIMCVYELVDENEVLPFTAYEV